MSVRSFIEAVEDELAVLALAQERVSARHEAAFVRIMGEHLRYGMAFRLGLDLLPSWWVRMHDASQVDGRVILKGFAFDGAQFQIPGGPSFTLRPAQFLQALLDRKALEAQ